MSRYTVEIENTEYNVEILEDKKDEVLVVVNGREYRVSVRSLSGPDSEPPAARPQAPVTGTPAPSRPSPAAAPGEVRAPMPALVLEVFVRAGDRVDAGQVLLKIEAMKMENQVCAPSTGTVEEVCVDRGAEVREGELLMRISPS